MIWFVRNISTLIIFNIIHFIYACKQIHFIEKCFAGFGKFEISD